MSSEDFQDQMVAEGQDTFEDELIDALVRESDKLKKKGYEQQDVREMLLKHRKPDNLTDQKWRYLVRNAMEYWS